MRMRTMTWLLAWFTLFAGNLAMMAETMVVDRARSQITVAVVSTLHNFTGNLTNYQVKIQCDTNEVLPYVADVTFDFKDLKTGDPDRDKDMLKWLGYPTNSAVVFNLTGWKRDGTNTTAKGEMTMHGVKKPVEILVTVTTDHDNYDIVGSMQLDYRDFGLPVIRKMMMLKVDPQVTVRFHLAGKLEGNK